MTEEKYQNGDINWNTYSGKFKMFDKDGNEIPCEYLEQNWYNAEAQNYRSALEEIREIAEDVETVSSTRFYRIKNKINEVLSNDRN